MPVPKDVRINTTHLFIIKISNKQDLQQIAINHSSHTVPDEMKKLYKRYTANPCSFLVIDTTILSDNALDFRKNLLEEVKREAITIGENIRDEKLRHSINKAASKINALSSDNYHKNLTGKKYCPQSIIG